MILILGEDGVLEGYPSIEDAVLEIEALDAEEAIVSAFDQDCRRLEIEWIRPNKSGKKWLGLLQAVDNGEYTLVARGHPDLQAAVRMIRSAATVAPSASTAVEEIRRSAEIGSSDGHDSCIADRNGT